MQLPLFQSNAILLPSVATNSHVGAKVNSLETDHSQRTLLAESDSSSPLANSSFEAIVKRLAQHSQESSKQNQAISGNDDTTVKVLQLANPQETESSASELSLGQVIDLESFTTIPETELSTQQPVLSQANNADQRTVNIHSLDQQSIPVRADQNIGSFQEGLLTQVGSESTTDLPAPQQSQIGQASQQSLANALPLNRTQSIRTQALPLSKDVNLVGNHRPGTLGAPYNVPANNPAAIQSTNSRPAVDPFGSPIQPIRQQSQFNGFSTGRLNHNGVTDPLAPDPLAPEAKLLQSTSPHLCGVGCQEPVAPVIPASDQAPASNLNTSTEQTLVDSKSNSSRPKTDSQTSLNPEGLNLQNPVPVTQDGYSGNLTGNTPENVSATFVQQTSHRGSANSQPVQQSPVASFASAVSTPPIHPGESQPAPPLFGQQVPESGVQRHIVNAETPPPVSFQAGVQSRAGSPTDSVNNSPVLQPPPSSPQLHSDPVFEQVSRVDQAAIQTQPGSEVVAAATSHGTDLPKSIQTRKYKQAQNESGIANTDSPVNSETASLTDPLVADFDLPPTSDQTRPSLSGSINTANSNISVAVESNYSNMPVQTDHQSANVQTHLDPNSPTIHSDQQIQANLTSPPAVGSASQVQRFDALGDQTLEKFVGQIVEERAQQPVQEKNVTRVQIEIDPPELGEVRIEITKTIARTVATVTVANEYALQQMQSNIQTLQSSLESMGVEFQDVDLDDRARDANGQQDTGSHQEHHQQQSNETFLAEPDYRDPSGQTELKLKSAHVVDILI